MTVLKSIVALGLAGILLTGCASVNRLNSASEIGVHDAILASEQARCAVKPAPCLNDADFKAVNLSLNRIAVAGREFTKVSRAGTASTADVATFLAVVNAEAATLAKAFDSSVIAQVLQDLIKLEATLSKIMGKLPAPQARQ